MKKLLFLFFAFWVTSIFIATVGYASCERVLTIQSVTYTGKTSVPIRDSFDVKFSFTGDFVETCVGATEMRFDLRIKRKLGGEDSVSVTSGVSPNIGTQQVRPLFVDRGTLKTDPESYNLTVTATKFQLFAQSIFVKNESGQIISQIPPPGKKLCCPRVGSASIVNVIPSQASGKDTVKVSWGDILLANPFGCVVFTGTKVSVKATHVGGSVCNGSQFLSDPNLHEATVLATCPVEFLSSPDVQSIEATIELQLAKGPAVTISAQKSGAF